MGITGYEPAPWPEREPERERLVEGMGVLTIRNDPVLQPLVEDVRRCLCTSMAAVSIIYRDWQYVIAASGLSDGPSSRKTSFCGHVIAQPDELFCVLDAADDPRFAENPVVTDGLGVRFYAGVPLVERDGLAFGAVCAIDGRPRDRLTDQEAECLRNAADAVKQALRIRAASGPVFPAPDAG